MQVTPEWEEDYQLARELRHRADAIAEERAPGSNDQAIELLTNWHHQPDIDAQYSFLLQLSPEQLRVMLWCVLGQLTTEQANCRMIKGVIRRPEWSESYEVVARDPRFLDANDEDVFDWALLRFKGGHERYERTVAKRHRAE